MKIARHDRLNSIAYRPSSFADPQLGIRIPVQCEKLRSSSVHENIGLVMNFNIDNTLSRPYHTIKIKKFKN